MISFSRKQALEIRRMDISISPSQALRCVLATNVMAVMSMLATLSCAHADWSGTYTYEYSGGQTVGGSPIQQSYSLTLGQRPTDCSLSITGYQSDTSIKCSYDATSNAVTIAFASFGNGKVTNVYGVAQYSVGQQLLSLHGPEPVITHWDALTVSGIPTVGRYFHKGDK